VSALPKAVQARMNGARSLRPLSLQRKPRKGENESWRKTEERK